jgi:hypothetical protein
MNTQVKRLLEIGAEGGSLAIYGTSDPTERRKYRVGLVDSTSQMLGEEDGDQTIRRDSGWLDSWEAAIQALSVYPWPRLHPLFVAPEVSLAIWSVLQKCSVEASKENSEIDLGKWRSVIRESLGVLPDHPLASLIMEGLGDPVFAASWQDEADITFRPYAAAILELRHAVQMSADARHALIQELRQKKRVTLLSEVLGTQIPERVLQWSGHAAWEEFLVGDWNQFFSIALAEERHSAIAGVRAINRTLLKQFLLIPKPLRRKGLLNIVSRLEIPAHRWESLAINFAKVDSGMRPALLRKAATMEYRGEFWDLYFRCEGKYWQPFRFPATLPPSDLLEPISSPLDMDAEGLLMKNCLSTHTSRVLSGDRIYFIMRDKTPVDTELIREPSGWIPGHILGPENAPVAEDIATQVRNELSRMGHAITNGATDSMQADGYLEMLRRQAREIFSKEDVDAITQHLASIKGKSRSWTNGAYVIFAIPRGGFVQYMCSPDAQEYLCEIQSYKYEIRGGEYLDADAVDLIEKAGFVWPTHKVNFLRWFKATSSADIQGIAEFTLAALHSLFHCPSVDELEVKSHIPADQIN